MSKDINIIIGEMSERDSLYIAFKEYSKIKKSENEIILRPVLKKNEYPIIKDSKKITGNILLVSLIDFYQLIKNYTLEEKAIKIIEWVIKNVHPYYFFKNNNLLTTDAEYGTSKFWNYIINELKLCDINVRDFFVKLEQLNFNKNILILYKTALFGNKTELLKRIEITEIEEEKESYKPTVDERGKRVTERTIIKPDYHDLLDMSKNEIINKIRTHIVLNMREYGYGLFVDDNGEFAIKPTFKDVFTSAEYCLSQYLTMLYNDKINQYDKVNVQECRHCHSLFVKNGKKQYYCKRDECQKTKDNIKSAKSYAKNGKKMKGIY